MRRLALLLAALLLPVSAEAQNPQDSVQVTIYDVADVRLDISPVNYRGFRGDTVTFTATAVDTITGDTLDVELLWTTDNPGAVTLDPQTGFATFNNRGQYNVYVEIVSFNTSGLTMAAQFGDNLGTDEWQWAWSVDGFTATVGDSGRMCAFGYDVVQNAATNSQEVTYTFKSEAVCPDAGGSPLPVEAVTWSSSNPDVLCFTDGLGGPCIDTGTSGWYQQVQQVDG